jgi:hypothetical protein
MVAPDTSNVPAFAVNRFHTVASISGSRPPVAGRDGLLARHERVAVVPAGEQQETGLG